MRNYRVTDLAQYTLSEWFPYFSFDSCFDYTNALAVSPCFPISYKGYFRFQCQPLCCWYFWVMIMITFDEQNLSCSVKSYSTCEHAKTGSVRIRIELFVWHRWGLWFQMNNIIASILLTPSPFGFGFTWMRLNHHKATNTYWAWAIRVAFNIQSCKDCT